MAESDRQANVPPYDDQRGAPSAEGAEGVRKAFDASNAPEPGAAPPVSDEERSGVSATDMEPDAALGVGESRGGRAEDQAPDRDDVGTKDGRPVGKHADDVGEGSNDPQTPDLQTGDQGG
jgi:hypothetical protein